MPHGVYCLEKMFKSVGGGLQFEEGCGRDRERGVGQGVGCLSRERRPSLLAEVWVKSGGLASIIAGLCDNWVTER